MITRDSAAMFKHRSFASLLSRLISLTWSSSWLHTSLLYVLFMVVYDFMFEDGTKIVLSLL